MAYLMVMLLMLVIVVVPVVIFTVARVVPRVVDRTMPPVDRFVSGSSPEVEARLTRIEDAIDAMAVEIERLRTGDLPQDEPRRRITGSAARD